MQQRNKKNHSTNLAKTLLLVGALSSLTPVAAFAKEVKIPVSISGVGGTVSIVSKDNNESYDLSIPDNGTGSITIDKDKYGTYEYTIKMKDVKNATKDTAVYDGYIYVDRDTASFSATRAGSKGTKVSKIEFNNKKKSSSSSSGGGGGSIISGSGYNKPAIELKPSIYDRPNSSANAGTTGGWQYHPKENYWTYEFNDGSNLKGGWSYIQNPYANTNKGQSSASWFYFDEKGVMQTGWIRDKNDERLWHYCNEISDGTLGAMKTGWHYDVEDNRNYYLDPITGVMWQGHVSIDNNEYYFARYEEVPHQTWYWVLENTFIGKWFYKTIGIQSYGAMYVNGTTPDGYVAGKDGSLTRPKNVTYVKASTTGDTERFKNTKQEVYNGK